MAYRAVDGTSDAAAGSKASVPTATSTKIRLRIGARTLTATLTRNATTRDFVSLLPLAVGDIIYWPPGPDLAIYYRSGGQAIPEPGIVVLARLNSGARAFSGAGTVRVKIERVR